MAVFTSTYVSLAHGAPNWDTQLRADLTVLQTILDQGSFTPAFGGSGATLGTGPLQEGYVDRLGQRITFHGRIVFGSGASLGSGVPIIGNLNLIGNLQPTTVTGDGWYQRTVAGADSGSPLPILYAGATASTAGIYLVGNGTSTPAGSIGTPAQADHLHFRISGILA